MGRTIMRNVCGFKLGLRVENIHPYRNFLFQRKKNLSFKEKEEEEKKTRQPIF